jgi:hypothetical protein
MPLHPADASFLRSVRMPEFKRGAGQPGQMAYGQAGALNTAVQAIPQQSPGAGAGPQPPSQSPQSPAPGASLLPEPPGLDFGDPTLNKFVLGPTQRPNEPWDKPLDVAPEPRGWEGWMPLMALVAEDPSSPPQGRAMFAQIMDRTRRRGG